jgi:uncharacterized membrane protein
MAQTGTANGTRENHRRGVPWSGRHDFTHPSVKKMHDERTLGERVADSVARFGGSWPFIFSFLGIIGVWMILNTVLIARVLHGHQFDPYPYIAPNLTLSAMAGLQAPIIMMSQNRSAARDEALAADHYREGRKIEHLIVTQEKLLDENTQLTQRVHELTQQIHSLISKT